MRKHKYMLAQFTFYDRTGIQRMLENQAGKGWLLDKISNFTWRFRRIEPREVHYAVTYFPSASQFDPVPGEDQQELFDFCRHSGWILAGTTAQLQVFYNEQPDPVPIETDPMIELENIRRSVKKSFLPGYLLLFFSAVLQIVGQLNHIRKFPLVYLSAETTLFNLFSQCVLLLLTGVEIIGYLLWYRRARKAAENGEFVQTRGHRTFQMVLLWCLLAALAVTAAQQGSVYVAGMLVALGMFAVILAVIYGATALMKKLGTEAKTNRNVTLTLAVVLSIAVTGAAGYVLGKLVRSPIWKDDRIVGTTQVGGITYDIYGDELPLKVEDLLDIRSPDYSCRADVQCTPVLRRESYQQEIWGPSELPDLEYMIYVTRFSGIYDLCVRETQAGNDYRPVDPQPWGANQAFQRYRDENPIRRYILCYEDRVVDFSPGWDMTEAQMALVGQTLGQP